VDLRLTDEQRLLRESAERYFRDHYSFAARRAIQASRRGYSADVWRQYADMGWLALPFPESAGGLGGGPPEIMLLMEAFGGALALEPYVATVVVAGRALTLLGGDQAAALTEGIVAGERIIGLACHEPRSRYAPERVATRAARLDGGWRLDGAKSLVERGANADTFLVPARTAGEPGDRDGISLFAVPADAPGVGRHDYATVDGGAASDLLLEAVVVEDEALIGPVGEALPAIEAAVREGAVAVAAEAVGAMGALVRQTAEYLQDREQFGRPLAGFQVLQHRIADMYMLTEKVRSLAIMAALRIRDDDPVRAERAASAAKFQAGRSGRWVSQQAVQLHGGMGISDELAVGHYFRRLAAIDASYGNADHHLARFAALSSG
jgi:alkylation response protein AidB-like acyl-CoA dehydrogenase